MIIEVVSPKDVRADPVLVQSETKLIPALTIAERYDSNVFFINGKGLEDYVTTIAPQLRMDHSGRLISGNLIGTLTGEAYVKNPGINYIAPSGAITMNLDKLIGQLDRRARLTVSDSFMFTPKPLAFIGPTTGSEVPDTFVRGIQASRANSRTNVAAATGGYQLSPMVSLQGNYVYSTMRFGTIFAQPNLGTPQPGAGSFFSTTFQNYSIGPQFQVTPLDSFSVTFQGSRADYSNAGTSRPSSSFITKGGSVGWIRLLTPTLTANGSGGFTEVGSGPSATLTYVANASLEWKHEHGGAALRYNRSVFPSFFVVPVPLVSEIITVSGSYSLSENISLMGSANYAKNEAVGSAQLLNFESYSASGSLNYTITRSVTAIASYIHSEFNQSSGANSITFNRNVVSLSLRGEWN